MDSPKDTNANETKDTFKTKDSLCRFVFLKVEKLTSALYMVSDFLSDNEPLKWKLRTLSLELLSGSNSLSKDKKDFFGFSGLNRMSFEINEIVTLLDVACVGGAVSQMNFQILKNEYQNLSDLISTQLSENSLKKYISDESLANFQASNSIPAVGSGLTNLIRKNLSGENVKSSGTANFSLTKSIGQKDIKKDSVNDLYGLNASSEKKSLRKEQILNFLKDKSWTGIVEISKALPDCGPKTIQRELQEMVSNNILKKQGERRWSRYMIA